MSAEFEEDPPRLGGSAGGDPDTLLLNLDGYEGPIDVLLQLARDQKVDLTEISILQLARQYLAFVDRARALRLELAAEYLVMAAWLAYLKSRLLLPREEGGGNAPSGEELAGALAFQLRRLEAMREAGQALMNRPQLGRDVFARHAPEGLGVQTALRYEAALYDLLEAYGAITRRREHSEFRPAHFVLMTADEAMSRLEAMLGKIRDGGWSGLHRMLPGDCGRELYGRSAVAAMLGAALEMTRQGQTEIRQDAPFRPVYLRRAASEGGGGGR